MRNKRGVDISLEKEHHLILVYLRLRVAFTTSLCVLESCNSPNSTLPAKPTAAGYAALFEGPGG